MLCGSEEKRGRNVGRQAQRIATSTCTIDQTQGSTSDPDIRSVLSPRLFGIMHVQLTSDREIEYIFGMR